MRIFDNGIVRDMTPEEEEAYANTPEPGSADDPIPADAALEIVTGEVPI